ncbi:FxsB family cyclophane-forming radical SAM/SPASM peptide maturase [Planotetraspora kaengkrachanensis]
MAAGWRPTPFRQFILKIHSRCDLACDYCYVYEMADSSWKNRPKRMPAEVVAAAAERIGEHARAHGLPEVEVILHGGEPLLAGVDFIREIVTLIRSATGEHTRVAVTLQTNATLLNVSYLRLFDELGIKVGVSLDGDQAMHDRSRRFANGRGSHGAVTDALRLLTSPPYRHLFGGLLCTIDLRNDPVTAYEALLEFEPPAVDFLLPHGNWSAPPPGRTPEPEATPYADWLIDVFDRWYHTRPQRTRIRMFAEIIHLILGGRSSSEQIGLSPAALVVVETDGGIEQSDFLKSAYDGAPETGLHISRNSFDEALALPMFVARQIGERALSPTCTACTVKRVCGGGLYAHRYREGEGFANPSVYCPDLLHLIGHVRDTVEADIRHRRSRRPGSVERSTMKPNEHRISAATFSALATGVGGRDAVSQLRAAQHSKHVLLVRGVMEEARVHAHPDAAGARRAYDLLATIQRHHPGIVERVLRHPSVGAWARQAIIALRSGERSAAPGQLAAVAASAAILSGTACDIDVPATEGIVTLPSLGQAVLPPMVETATVQCHTHGAEIAGGHAIVTIPADPRTDGPGWTGLRDLSAEAGAYALHVVVDDLDPYRMPGVANLRERLPADEVGDWQTMLGEAWNILVRHHPQVAEDVSGAINVFTPLVAPAQGQTSASSRETFGCIALSIPPDPVTMAVTLAHETQHAKLSALLDLVPLTRPDDGSRYYAPWREDPRPVPGLLQGAYAYLGVTDFWRRQRLVESGDAATNAAAEFHQWRAAALMVTRTLLGSGRLTEPGEHFATTMAQRLDAWADEPVSPRAQSLSRERAERHLTRWRERNG